MITRIIIIIIIIITIIVIIIYSILTQQLEGQLQKHHKHAGEKSTTCNICSVRLRKRTLRTVRKCNNKYRQLKTCHIIFRIMWILKTI